MSLLKKITRISLFKDLLGKPNFSERLSFHREMMDLTNFGLEIGVCNIDAMIFKKKKNGQLLQDQFY